MIRSLMPFAVALLAGIAGCGGGGSSKPPDTAKGAVDAFIANVKSGDWKAACEPISPGGGEGLVTGLHLPNSELDDFGTIKDCPATLARHAAAIRAMVAGGTPGAVSPAQNGFVPISSPHGNWTVLREGHTDGTHRWVIEQTPDFPPGS